MRNKLLTFITLSLIAIIMITGEVKANEVDADNIVDSNVTVNSSVYAVTYVEIPINTGFPERIWHTKGNYGGYLTLESYERTPDFTYRGKYTGYLRYMVAPNKTDEES